MEWPSQDVIWRVALGFLIAAIGLFRLVFALWIRRSRPRGSGKPTWTYVAFGAGTLVIGVLIMVAWRP
jgi:hypothetical protein